MHSRNQICDLLESVFKRSVKWMHGKLKKLSGDKIMNFCNIFPMHDKWKLRMLHIYVRSHIWLKLKYNSRMRIFLNVNVLPLADKLSMKKNILIYILFRLPRLRITFYVISIFVMAFKLARNIFEKRKKKNEMLEWTRAHSKI